MGLGGGGGGGGVGAKGKRGSHVWTEGEGAGNWGANGATQAT